jgi:penicillin G amidase
MNLLVRAGLVFGLVAGAFAITTHRSRLEIGAGQSALEEQARRALARIDGEIELPGLKHAVRIARDEWGVPHISAAFDEDLFFAQGYAAAQDRLWQMEMWRRSAEGRLAEILGPQAVSRDRLARLLKYRPAGGAVDDEELTSYHPDARRLMTAFVNGVNTFITQHADRLPVEFVLTGIKPEPWTLDTLTLRQTTFGDATSELQLARSVAELGAAEANRRRNPDPWDDLKVPDGLDVSIIGEEVVNATRVGGARLPPPQLLSFRSSLQADRGGEAPRYVDIDDRHAWIATFAGGVSPGIGEPGSNNWVVSGAMSTTGKPVVVNDPHREVTLPSLRYIFHLQAPGWNVIGASEPPFLGVAIGHNERVAWGLTIVGTDQHDVYVEEINPAKANEVKWNGRWEPLRIIREEIGVKGAAAVTIELKFSRHGPIFYEDKARGRAYALRSALLEPGAAPYLAGLRLSQTKNCREFLDAAMYWKYPSENLICGDIDGNIAWQASALTPNRQGWVGRLPVPGHGAYEWQGFRADLPREYNPSRAFIATANNNIQPDGYTPPLMFKNADTRFDRITRLRQLLVPGRTYSLDDHQRMQNDAFSLRAAADVPLFKGWTAADADVEHARALLAGWDAVYTKDSAAAALYEAWRAAPARTPASPQPGAERQAALETRLRTAIDGMTKIQGGDWKMWRWGRMHARAFPHPFVSSFDLAAVERPGGAGTVAADGASYREILDVSNWDRSVATNIPGQSGQPGSPYYSNLLPLWAENRYFPLLFTNQAIESRTSHRLTLKPREPPR